MFISDFLEKGASERARAPVHGFGATRLRLCVRGAQRRRSAGSRRSVTSSVVRAAVINERFRAKRTKISVTFDSELGLASEQAQKFEDHEPSPCTSRRAGYGDTELFASFVRANTLRHPFPCEREAAQGNERFDRFELSGIEEHAVRSTLVDDDPARRSKVDAVHDIATPGAPSISDLRYGGRDLAHVSTKLADVRRSVAGGRCDPFEFARSQPKSVATSAAMGLEAFVSLSRHRFGANRAYKVDRWCWIAPGDLAASVGIAAVDPCPRMRWLAILEETGQRVRDPSRTSLRRFGRDSTATRTRSDRHENRS